MGESEEFPPRHELSHITKAINKTVYNSEGEEEITSHYDIFTRKETLALTNLKYKYCPWKSNPEKNTERIHDSMTLFF